MFKTKVETGGLLDHTPITLSITKSEEKPPAPFKFNLNWLDCEEYWELLKKSWKPIEVQSTKGCMFQIMENLSKIKIILKEWGSTQRI